MKTRESKTLGKQVKVDGMMAFGKLKNGQRILDFECCEDVAAEPFSGTFHIQVMRDGNVYMTEKVKHPKNDPLFRDDNCSFSHGRNRKYYFVFTLDDDRIDELPYLLTRQSGIIAQKVLRKILCDKEVMQ